MKHLALRLFLAIALAGAANYAYSNQYTLLVWGINISGRTTVMSFQRTGALLALVPAFATGTQNDKNFVEVFFYSGDPTGVFDAGYLYPPNGTLNFATNSAWYCAFYNFCGELIDLTWMGVDQGCVGMSPDNALWRTGNLINTFSSSGQATKISGGVAWICPQDGGWNGISGVINLQGESTISHNPEVYQAQF